MPKSPTGRHRADDALILALACGAQVEAAAAKASVSPATAFRRLKDPEFQAKLQTARTEMVQRATAMLTAAAMEAVKTLLDLQGKTCPATTRLGAAKAVLEIGSRLRTENELISRLEAAERALGLRA
jgi:succinylglutamate desuccinylase